MSAPRLTAAQKDEIIRRYVAGDKIATIAAAFGVDRSYPGMLAKRRGLALWRQCFNKWRQYFSETPTESELVYEAQRERIARTYKGVR